MYGSDYLLDLPVLFIVADLPVLDLVPVPAPIEDPAAL